MLYAWRSSTMKRFHNMEMELGYIAYLLDMQCIPSTLLVIKMVMAVSLYSSTVFHPTTKLLLKKQQNGQANFSVVYSTEMSPCTTWILPLKTSNSLYKFYSIHSTALGQGVLFMIMLVWYICFQYFVAIYGIWGSRLVYLMMNTLHVRSEGKFFFLPFLLQTQLDESERHCHQWTSLFNLLPGACNQNVSQSQTMTTLIFFKYFLHLLWTCFRSLMSNFLQFRPLRSV